MDNTFRILYCGVSSNNSSSDLDDSEAGAELEARIRQTQSRRELYELLDEVRHHSWLVGGDCGIDVSFVDTDGDSYTFNVELNDLWLQRETVEGTMGPRIGNAKYSKELILDYSYQWTIGSPKGPIGSKSNPEPSEIRRRVQQLRPYNRSKMILTVTSLGWVGVLRIVRTSKQFYTIRMVTDRFDQGVQERTHLSLTKTQDLVHRIVDGSWLFEEDVLENWKRGKTDAEINAIIREKIHRLRNESITDGKDDSDFAAP